jgi:hypothetical protein
MLALSSKVKPEVMNLTRINAGTQLHVAEA